MTPAPHLVRVDPHSPDRDTLRDAARALHDGALVVFPTETVYGLGANALDAHAVSRIFTAKGRPATNPLIVHVTRLEDARALTSHWPEEATVLAKHFWPGPLTLILPKHPDVPDAVTAGRANVALRIPAHPVARLLIELAGVPVCAPSANPYMGISPTRAAHVLATALADRVEWIVDGGETDVGVESTVLSLLDVAAPVVLRPGMITPEAIAQVLGRTVRVHTAVHGEATGEGALSPGMAARHYAPRGELLLVDVIPWGDMRPGRVGVLCLEGEETQGNGEEACLLIVMPRDPALYARRLYDTLYRFDEHGAAIIYVQLPSHEEAWRAVHDRLMRASTPL